MSRTNDIGAALAAVEQRIVAACHAAGRQRSSVTLIAVSKTMPADRIRQAVAAGQLHLGENRVQEALEKMPGLASDGSEVAWHLIGHLQRNKARQVIGRFELIHTIDDARLARELDRRSAAAGLRQGILVQVNVSDEPTKSGVSRDQLPRLLDEIAPLEALELRGLMTIPPPVERPEHAARWFDALRDLRDSSAAALDRPLPELSMGMTHDFETAIACGATLIRVGRAIFGERR